MILLNGIHTKNACEFKYYNFHFIDKQNYQADFQGISRGVIDGNALR